MHQDIITIEPRIKGKIIEQDGQKYPSLSFPSPKEKMTEHDLVSYYNTFRAWLGTEDIEVRHSCFNSISNTWMVLSVYYGEEKRFVKF